MANLTQRRKRREVLSTLYTLERRFGVPAAVYEESNTNDVETGEIVTTLTKIAIPKCVAFKRTMQDVFEYDLSFVAANKNFTYGGLFEIGDRMVLFRKGTFPDGFEFKDTHYFVYLDERYQILKSTKMDFDLGFVLHVRFHQGSKPTQVHEKYVISHMADLAQDVSGVL